MKFINENRQHHSGKIICYLTATWYVNCNISAFKNFHNFGAIKYFTITD